MIFLVGLLLAVILVASTAFLSYNWGKQDGIREADWINKAAKAAKDNKTWTYRLGDDGPA